MAVGNFPYPLSNDPADPEMVTGPGYGKFMEGLRPEIKSSLLMMIAFFKDETLSARREEVKKAKLAREYWKGIQNIWWSESDQEWRFPFESLGSSDSLSDSIPRYSFVTNIYQAFGLSIIAVLSQQTPKTRLFPQSTQQPEDVTTAHVGSEVIRLIQRNNEATEILKRIGYFSWTDGKVAGYMRYVEDGLRFGWKDQPIMEQGQMSLPGEQASYGCPNCGGQTPMDQLELEGGGECPGCGAALGDEHLQQPMQYDVPMQTGSQRIPKGQEILDIFGALEIRTPMWCNKQSEYPYLIWSQEIHRSKLQHTYPHVRDVLSSEVPSGGEDTYERQVRLRLNYSGIYDEAGTPSANLITFDRVWLRPWVFEQEADETLRAELYELFPEGCYVAFAADQFCEARSENMDDYWTVMQPMPGDGQNRPAIGTALISIQERYNTLLNLVVENIEFGVPPIYADDSVVDFDALEDQTAEPGSHYPVTSPASGKVSDGFYQPQPMQIANEAYRHIQDLAGPMAQFQTGAFPSLFGGSASNIDTASGYAMSRDQALGRQGIFWRTIKMFWDQCMVKGVMVYRNNRDEDLEIPLGMIGEAFDSKMIRLDELKGNVVVFSETDEQFPELWSQQRRTLLEIMGMQSPELQEVLAAPENMKLVKDLIGLKDLDIPGENSRDKQYREITRLLQELPIPEGDQGAMSSSVDIDIFDDHAAELSIVTGWINSAEGQKSKEQNPMGFLNVRAHGLQHREAIQLLEAQQMEQELAMQVAQTNIQPPQAPAAAPAKKESKK